MAFTFGTLNTSTAAAASTLVTTIETALSSAGYTLYATTTDFNGYTERVWLNPASLNSAGVAWYFSMSYLNASLFFSLGQSFDTASRSFSKYAYAYYSTTSRTIQADGTVAGTYVPNSGTGGQALSLALTATSSYVVSASKDRLVVATNVATTAGSTNQIQTQPFVYVGMGETLVASTAATDLALMLLVPASIGSSVAANILAGGTTQDWGFPSPTTSINAYSLIVGTLPTGAWSSTKTTDPYTSRIQGSRVLVSGQTAAALPSTTVGSNRALLRDVLIMPTIAYAFQDEFTFAASGGGTTRWMQVLALSGNSFYVNEGV